MSLLAANLPSNNRMQSDFLKRYALSSAADAKRYVAYT
jgi:hypothetical protein